MAINGISKMKNDLEEKNEEFLKKEKKNEELKVLIIELKEKIADFDNSIKTSNKKIAEITNENKEYRNETRTQTE
jgi:predicted  nucleic acid-binding Zn-ribbon protein